MAETYGGAERRKYPRREEHMFVSYSASRIPEIRTSATRNLSGAGLCFKSEIGLSPGDVHSLLKSPRYRRYAIKRWDH